METKKKKNKDHWILDILLTIPELIFLAVRGIVRGIISLIRFWN